MRDAQPTTPTRVTSLENQILRHIAGSIMSGPFDGVHGVPSLRRLGLVEKGMS